MTETDITTPCAVCGNEVAHPDPHHMEPRGRRPDLRDDPANIAPVCRPCHARLIPEGTWELKRVGDLWVTCDAATGEEICRRPVEPTGFEVVAQIQHAADILDPRGEKAALLSFLCHLSDFDLEMLDKVGAIQHQNGARVRALVRYEVYMRHPLKHGAGQWITDIAKRFDVAENTVYQDVRAAEFYAEDPGPPKDWSWYREALRSSLSMAETLRIMNEVWETHGSVRDFRRELGDTDDPEWCICSCGNRHHKKT